MSTQAPRFVIAILLVVSFPALATVYKCESPEGRITFTDTPCSNAAASQQLEKFNKVITRQVDASVSHRQTTRRYVDGYAYWAKPDRELTAVLYPRALTEEELARVAKGERLNTFAEESTGRVTLLFDEPRAGRGTLQHMRSVFTGFSADNPKSPWTSNHRKNDLTGVLQAFGLGADDEGTTWLQFRSRENTEHIRWQIEFALPVEP